MDSTAKRTGLALVAAALAAAFGLGAWLYPQAQPLADRPFESARSAPAPQVIAECVRRANALKDEDARGPVYAKCLTETEQHRLTTNDLIQQTRAADAAAAQARIGEQVLWLGWLQTIGGLLTLLAAAAAAWFARDAAIQGRRSADSAHASSRAWLKLRVEPDGFVEYGDDEDFIFNPTIHVDNVGASPATNGHIIVDIDPYLGDPMEFEYYSMVKYHHEKNENWIGDGIGFSIFPKDSYSLYPKLGPTRYFNKSLLRRIPTVAITVVYETANLHCLTTKFFNIKFSEIELDQFDTSKSNFKVTLSELQWDRAT